MGLRVCLLLGYLLAAVEAFRTPVGAQNALSNALSNGGQRGSYIIMHAYTSRAVISRRAIGQLALGTALVTLRGKTASAEFPKISSLTKEDIDSWVELDGDSGLRLKEISAGLGAETKDGDRWFRLHSFLIPYMRPHTTIYASSCVKMHAMPVVCVLQISQHTHQHPHSPSCTKPSLTSSKSPSSHLFLPCLCFSRQPPFPFLSSRI
jgi:hypothetical protein